MAQQKKRKKFMRIELNKRKKKERTIKEQTVRLE